MEKTPPEHVRKYMDSFINNGDVLKAEEWETLFKKVGFQNVVMEMIDVNFKEETFSHIKQINGEGFFQHGGKQLSSILPTLITAVF